MLVMTNRRSGRCSWCIWWRFWRGTELCISSDGSRRTEKPFSIISSLGLTRMDLITSGMRMLDAFSDGAIRALLELVQPHSSLFSLG